MAKTKLKATGDWLIVDPLNKTECDREGIIIPEVAQESLKADAEPAIVISAGEDCSEGLKPGVTAFVLLGSCLTLPMIDGKSYLTCKNARVAGFKVD